MKKYLAVLLCFFITFSNLSVGAENQSSENLGQAYALNDEVNSKIELVRKHFAENKLVEYKGEIVSEENNVLVKADLEETTKTDNAKDEFYIGGPVRSYSKYVDNTSSDVVVLSEDTLRAVSTSDYQAMIAPAFRNGVDHPHLAGRSYSDYVSQFDGSLQLNYTDMSLPGRNGLDLTIGRFYKSELSNVEAYNDENGYHVSPTTYLNKRYALGIGWSFAFPSVELRQKSDGSLQAYYHDGTGATYRSNYNDSTKNEAGEDYYNGNLIYSSNLDNLYTDNVKFKEGDRSYSRGDYRSEYSFKTEDNTMQYFGDDGELLAIKDRFDNEISFDYKRVPGESLIPYYSYEKYNLESEWEYDGNRLTFAGSSLKKTGTARTQRVELDSFSDDYYISLLYEANSDISGDFSGRIDVYCDLYNGSIAIDKIKVAEVTPTVHNEAIPIEARISLSDYVEDMPATHANLRIRVVNAKHKVHFTDIRLSPEIPLISKITDTIGRTVEFDYQGDVYKRYEEYDDFPMILTVKSPDGEEINTIRYSRDVYTHDMYTEDDDLGEYRYYMFWGCDNGVTVEWVDYESFSGMGSTYYANPNTSSYYEFYGRKIVNEAVHLNSSTYYEYESVRKWTDNRPRGSTTPARNSNTGFIDTWRVSGKYDVMDSSYDSEPSRINEYQYNYASGEYEDETGYTLKDKISKGPGYIDPELGTYKVVVTTPSGSIETYEYTSHTFDKGYRRKWKIVHPLLDKSIYSDDGGENADTIITEYTYDDDYAIISPTEIKTTETIGGIARVYYNITEYDPDSCLPAVTSFPLTEEEKNATNLPEEKLIKTQYEYIGNRMFLPKSKQYYKKAGGNLLTEKYNFDSLGRVSNFENAKGDVVNYEYDTVYPWLPSREWVSDPQNSGDADFISEKIYLYEDNLGLGATKEKIRYSNYNAYATTAYEYEPSYGNITKVTDSVGNTTQYSYDKYGRVEYIYYPSYSTESGNRWLREKYIYDKYESYENNWFQRVTKQIGTSITSTSFGTVQAEETVLYDDFGNIHYTETEMGEERYVYDDALRVIGYRNPVHYGTGINTLTYTYDGFNRITAATDSLGNTQKAEYKSLLTEYYFVPAESETAENHYSEKYDMYGNKIEESIYPLSTSNPLTISYEYDLTGNITKVTDAKGNITISEYDEIGNPIKIIKPNGEVVTKEYTKWNSVKTTSVYEGDQPYNISQTFDNRGLVLSHRQNSPDVYTVPWNYSYRADGKIRSISSPNGIDGSYEYDAIGNNTLKKMGNITDTMVYNHFGQVDKVTRTISGAVSDTIDYTYDSAKGLMLSKETDEKITSYAYNSLGSVTSITSPSWLTRTYTRDSLDRISSVSADNKNFTYEYYGDGQIKKVIYPNTDITTEYTYDNANRLTSVVTKNGASIVYNCQYTYDNANNIISVTGTETANYTYDSLNRLKTSTQNGVTTTYEYDGRNNLISETSPNITKTYEYGGDNRLYKVTENGNETIYEYDPNGNLIKRGNDEFAYDHENKLLYSDVNGIITTYETGADGLRRSKTTEGVTTTYQWDENGNVICENGNEIILGHTPLAIKVDGAYYYYVYNGHCDVVMLIDEEGNVKNSYSYNAWGDIAEKSETIDNPFTYYGQIYDEETGLYYLRARYYDPKTKRFITEDPAKDGLNWYIYASNNPVNYIDPWGLAPTKEEAAAMADHIYDWEKDSARSDRTVAGWRLIDVWRGRESMKMGIYIKDSDDWQNPSEYALVFRGSIIQFNTETIDVWKNNAEQFLSAKSADMWDAINYSVGFTNSHSQEITFIGHSKGGAEALAAAVATGKNAIVFNPAKPNLRDYNLSAGNYNGNATSYVVRGEILNNLFGEPGVGRVEYLNQKYKTPWYFVGDARKIANIVNPIRNHLMEAVLSGI